MTLDDHLAELATLTGMSKAEWLDFCSSTPDQQAVIVETYRGADWVQAPDRFAQVLAVLTIAGGIAGAVSGIAGAASAVAALKSI